MTPEPLLACQSIFHPAAHLDPPETPVDQYAADCWQGPGPEPYELIPHFRHDGWQSRRKLIFDAMIALNLRHNRIDAFRGCGSDFWILRNKTDPELFKRVPDFCHDRFCVPCARLRQATIRNNLAKSIGDHPHRFLTLTIRHGSEPLSKLIHKLYDSFRRLRLRAIWKEHVTGGVAFLELAYNLETRSWHPHLHIVLEGTYLHRPDLSRIWLQVTGDSHNVDIKLVRDKLAVTDYVSKYATKPIPANVFREPDLLQEAISVLKGRRMLITFGTWRSFRLARIDANADWELYLHESSLRFRACDARPDYVNVVAMLHTADPTTGIFTVVFEDIPP